MNYQIDEHFFILKIVDVIKFVVRSSFQNSYMPSIAFNSNTGHVWNKGIEGKKKKAATHVPTPGNLNKGSWTPQNHVFGISHRIPSVAGQQGYS